MANLLTSLLKKTFAPSLALGLGLVLSHAGNAQVIPNSAPPLPGAENYSVIDASNMGIVETLTASPVDDGPRYRTLSSMLTDDLALPSSSYPAVLESTGTWLRRGLWYADLDAVIMTRTWDNDGKRLLFESAAGNEFQIDRERRLEESSPGADGAARLALGRFLFRDQKNRDHTAEFIAFGGAEWVDNGSMEAIDGSFLRLPNEVIHGSDASFNGAQESTYSYSSHFNTFELNYNVTERMRKDQMQLQPTGEWIRRAAGGWTQNYLVGFRYFELQEDVDWTASEIISIDADTSGEMNVRSSNNMFGVQFGHGLTYETDRWNISLFSKHGMYINDARASTDLAFEDLPSGTDAGFSSENHENSLAYLMQAGITGRYHLRPNLSLRIGYEFLFATGLALAPNDISFDANQPLAGVSGDVFYRGFTFGSEYYW